MNYRLIILFSTLLIIAFSCAKEDNNRPYISGLKVNDIGTDTVYLVNGDLNVNYEISDDEIVVESKIKLVQEDNLDSGFFFLSFAQVNAKNYSGSQYIFVPDSIKKHSKLFELSIDAYDDSGNEAYQLTKLINFK